MTVSDAFTLVGRAIDSGHAAHGYLVCGDLKGDCMELAGLILRKLFPGELSQIEGRSHPDVTYLEPEGKSRTIHTDSMRDRLIAPMSTTAFSGGWKVGVIVGADRMETAAANSFLKLLEEPTPRTLFLLLTDRPDSILPTIVSRTQRIDLPVPPGILEGEAYDAIAAVFSAKGLEGVYRKDLAARRLAELLGELKDAAEDEDVPVVRKAFYKTIMQFVRGWMVSGALPAHQAFRNIEAVEEASRRTDRYMSDDAVLSSMTDRIVWP